MAKSQLALFGGQPINSEPWPVSNAIGEEEKRAVMEVLDSGVLSQFRAAPGEDFLGGPNVRQLEEAWAQYFGVKHAVSFNSLTSGLFAAIGAAGIGPGDEVIVSPYTMTASATCAITYGGIPIFADIDPVTYCMDPVSIEAQISPRTRAIVIVHLFGHPADMNAVMAIANKHGLMVIEDCAQAPAAKYKGRYVGTMGQIGGFSLNYHKTIHSGEGGVMVTDDDDLALRLQLIRNHGEVSTEGLGVTEVANTFGGNTRMTEIEAAIGREQLRKLDWLTDTRSRLATYLNSALAGIPGITPQPIQDLDDRHVYYFYLMDYQAHAAGLPRERFVEAVRAEGVELRQAYLRPIYWEPMYQQKKAFNKGQFPFVSEFHDSVPNYDVGLCPVTEAAFATDLIFGNFCRWPLTEAHVDQVVAAFHKVLEHKEELADI